MGQNFINYVCHPEAFCRTTRPLSEFFDSFYFNLFFCQISSPCHWNHHPTFKDHLPIVSFLHLKIASNKVIWKKSLLTFKSHRLSYISSNSRSSTENIQLTIKIGDFTSITSNGLTTNGIKFNVVQKEQNEFFFSEKNKGNW